MLPEFTFENLDDANAQIAAAEAVLAKAKQARDELTPHKYQMKLARALHDTYCTLDHTEHCAFGYEEGWIAEPSNPLAKDVWTNPIREHTSWLKKAKAFEAKWRSSHHTGKLTLGDVDTVIAILEWGREATHGR